MAAGTQRTRQAMAARFAMSSRGIIFREKAGKKHRLVAKSSKSKGLTKMKHEVSKGDAKNIIRAFGI